MPEDFLFSFFRNERHLRSVVLSSVELREIAMIGSPKLRIRSRVPVQAWAFAGLVTLFSLVSSLTHVVASPEAAYAAYAASIWW